MKWKLRKSNTPWICRIFHFPWGFRFAGGKTAECRKCLRRWAPPWVAAAVPLPSPAPVCVGAPLGDRPSKAATSVRAKQAPEFRPIWDDGLCQVSGMYVGSVTHVPGKPERWAADFYLETERVKDLGWFESERLARRAVETAAERWMGEKV